MRELVYVLSNGKEVKTMHEAEVSGLSYRAEMRKVKADKGKLSPIRQAMLEQFGFVHKSLRNKVSL